MQIINWFEFKYVCYLLIKHNLYIDDSLNIIKLYFFIRENQAEKNYLNKIELNYKKFSCVELTGKFALATDLD